MEELQGIKLNVSEVLSEKISEIATQNISKEELTAIACRAIHNVSSRPSTYTFTPKSIVDNLALEKISSLLGEEIEAILNTPKYKENVKKESMRILEDMQKKYHDAIVETFIKNMCLQSTDFCGGVFEQRVREIIFGVLQNR